MPACPWDTPPEAITLPGDEVHAWRATLDGPPARAEGLRAILSEEEREKADRFRFETDRARFTAARGALRLILARYLHADPADLTFRYTAHGKPALAGEQRNLFREC